GAVGTSTGSGEFTTEEKNIGEKSLKISKTNTNDRQYFSQQVTLEKGKYYTLSGYIKTKNVKNENGRGALIYANYQYSASSWPNHDSAYLNGTQDWQRVEVTFMVPPESLSDTVYIGAGIYGETGTAYFDNLQLEEGAIANRYNLIENPSLEDGNTPLFWNRNPNLTDDDKSSAGIKMFGGQSFKINGEYSWLKSIYQVVKVSGKKDDVIVVSGWAKAQSVPLSSNRNFAIYLGVTGLDGTTIMDETLQFNPDTTDWQYMSNAIKTSSDYKSITMYLMYYNNENEVYFDGIQMYKEEFGESYDFDENGNLKSIKDLAEQTSKFEYNTNNDLIRAVDPKGGNFTYEYDQKRNISKAASAENVVYTFTYDSYGNPLTAKVGGDLLFIKSTSAYTPNGNYIRDMTDSSGNKVTYNYNQTKGTLDSVVDPKGKQTSYG
ncbi:carbohydrate binding domain-containing protein, partial [Oxobacter pfennigii]|uniref:carbohydrate binding domain-containing protein n=1 Tax=Oxobacter pfennigii TaxID=36849 RepID=UPI000A81CC60